MKCFRAFLFIIFYLIERTITKNRVCFYHRLSDNMCLSNKILLTSIKRRKKEKRWIQMNESDLQM